MIEFLAHRSERDRLDLDQVVAALDVDDKAAEWYLELVIGLGIQLFERRMERAFVESADLAHRRFAESGRAPMACSLLPAVQGLHGRVGRLIVDRWPPSDGRVRENQVLLT